MPCPLHLFKDTSSFKQNVNILFPSNYEGNYVIFSWALKQVSGFIC